MMIVNLFFTTLILASHNGQMINSKIETPTTQIVIQAQKIFIPHIPTTVEQARKDYKQMDAYIKRAILDLEKDLLELYTETPHETPLPASIHVKPQEAEAVRFFNQLIADKDFDQLHQQVVDLWNKWITIMIECGLGSQSENKKIKVKPLSTDTKETIKQLSRIKKSDASKHNDRVNLALFYDVPLEAISPSHPDLLWINESTERLYTNFKHNTISNQNAPEIYRWWRPLAEHLHACAETFVHLDTLDKDGLTEDLYQVRRHAKIAFLERCRSSLWLCQKIWARMASRDELPHLKPIQPILK